MGSGRILFWSLVLGIAIYLGGCSDDKDPPPPVFLPGPTLAANLVPGRVQLPMGAALSPAQLSVVTAVAQLPVQPSGDFVASLAADRQTLALAVTGGDRLALMGFVAPGQNVELSASSTALALLYFAVGGFTLPSDRQAALRSVLATHPALPAVVAAVEAAIRANPTAIADGDAGIDAALTFAQGLVLSEAQPAGSAQQAPLAAPAAVKLNVNPPAPIQQSGTTLEAAGESVLARNFFRRFQSDLFVFKTGSTDFNNVSDELPVAEPRPSAARPVAAATLTSVATLELTFTSIVTLLTSPTFVFTEATIPSSLIPAEENKRVTRYRVVQLSPFIGFKSIRDLGPQFSPFVRFFEERITNLQFRVLAFDVVFGVLAAVTGDAFEGFLKNKAALDAIEKEIGANVLAAVADSGLTVAQLLIQGQLGVAASATLTQVAQVGSPVFQRVLTALGELATTATERSALGTAIKGLAGANTVIKSVNLALAAADKVRLGLNLAGSNPLESWTVNAVRDVPFNPIMFAVESLTQRVVRINVDTGSVEAIGSGLPANSNPRFMAKDAQGDLIIVEAGSSNRLVRYTQAGTRTVIAGPLNGPFGVALTGAGDFVVGEVNSSKILFIPKAGGAPGEITMLPNSLSPLGLFKEPFGDTFLVGVGNTTTGFDRVRRVTLNPAGNAALPFDFETLGDFGGTGVHSPRSVALDRDNNLIVNEIVNSMAGTRTEVSRITPQGVRTMVATFPNTGAGQILVDPASGDYFLPVHVPAQLMRIPPNGPARSVATFTAGSLPQGLVQ